MSRRLALVAVAAGLLLFPAGAGAATIAVGTTADEFGPDTGAGCSLREAVEAIRLVSDFGGCTATAGGDGHTILLGPGQTYVLTLQGANEDSNETGDLDLPVSGSVRIAAAAGSGPPPAVDASGLRSQGISGDRLLDVTGGGSLTIEGIRLVGGVVDSSPEPPGSRGGALRWVDASGGDLSVVDSVLTGNGASVAGGAIEADTPGAHSIEGSTITGNFAADDGAVHSSGHLTVSGSTVSGNSGGGVSADGVAGSLSIESSALVNNSIGADSSIGAVFASVPATVTNTTISGNLGGFVGGIWAEDELDVSFSTIAYNGAPEAAGGTAGGIGLDAAESVTLSGVVLAGNFVDLSRVEANCSSPEVEQGPFPNIEDQDTCGFQSPSISGADPQLAPLAQNGGPTLSHGLYPESPALDLAEPDCAPLVEDQRGEGRPAGAGCDAGAFEGTVPRPAVPPPAAGAPAKAPASPKKRKKRKCARRKKAGKRKCGKKRSLAADPGRVVIGRSVRGRPIVATRLGDPEGERVALVVGVIHGDERAGLRVARELRAFEGSLAGTQIWLIRAINPDGLKAHARRNDRGVDLNRNFPHRWRGGVPRSSGYYPGRGPASEPETRAAMRFIERVQPDVSVWYHQPWGAVLACRGRPALAARYARLARMETSCRGDGLRGTAISWENATIPGSSAFVVEFPGGTISQRTARRHARAAAIIARDG